MAERPPPPRILVIDDHVEMARLLCDQLSDEGYAVEIATGGAAGIAAARARLPDVVISDLRMEKVDGFDVVDALRAIDATVPVLIMTAYGNVESAVEAMKRGAAHYLTKPFRLDEVLVYVQRSLEERRLREENRALREEKAAAARESIEGMVGKSEPMRRLAELVERVARTSAPVLIRGESGSGKELVARALHNLGARRDKAFVPINCTALPENLLESELFGHVKGAYTGAMAPRRGLFVEADGGTLFLDEIGDMPVGLQAKLLRVLEDGEVRAVGADASRRVDVRIVAATHQDLEQRVREGGFRQDLFFRLNVVPVAVPPLRARPEDIPTLVDHFVRRALAKNPSLPVRRFAPRVVTALGLHAWPGNVRELENVVERLMIVAGHEEVTPADLQLYAPGVAPAAEEGAAAPGFPRQLLPLRQMESEYIAWVVAQCGGNKTRAAEVLGIDVSTIHRREKERG